jgi:general secretion pathway protein D
MRRTGGLLCVAAGLLLSGCETLHPDIFKGHTVGEAEGPETVSTPVESEAVTTPTEIVSEREPRPAAFYEPGTGVFVGQPDKARTAAGEGNITLNFENTNLREVVKVILGDLLKQNYTIDPGVQGAVTLQTSEPLALEALIPTLELLLRMNGAALVHQNDLYHVVGRDSAMRGMLAPQLGNARAALPRGYSVRVVPLKFVSATEMQKILEPFAAAGNIVRVDTTRNLLILAGPGPELGRLLDTVQIFDVDWLEGMSVALFTPDFVDAQTLSNELQVVFGETSESPFSGLIQFVTLERLNALLVITPRPQYLDTVGEWVERLDRDSGGVGRRLFVYPVQNGKAADLAAVLEQVFADDSADQSIPPAELAPGLEPVEIASADRAGEATDTAAEGQAPRPPPGPVPVPVALAASDGLAITEGTRIKVIADEVNNALLILATAQQYKQVESALRQLDVPPLQVLIEATIAEIGLQGELQYGVEWFFKNHLNSGKTGIGTLDLGNAGLAALAPGFSYQVVGQSGQVHAVLNALADDKRLNVISSPSLMVLNNQTASIDVGDEVPITTQQQQSTVGGASPVVNSIEYRNTGVILSVTPRVNPGGLVTMDVEQEVSQVSEDSALDPLTPTISQRKIVSTVAVQSGQTVVLGGLIREQKSVSRQGIPGLYNLPIIGPLFGATSDDQTRTELVVLITPRAVRNSAEAAKVTEEFRSKMESLKPLKIPTAEDAEEEKKLIKDPDKRSWPRVGPDETSEAQPVKLPSEAPIRVTENSNHSLLLGRELDLNAD